MSTELPAVTKNEFNKALTNNGFNAQPDKYNNFLRGVVHGMITKKWEAAMAMAQFIHESGGLIHKEETNPRIYEDDNWAEDVECRRRYPHNRYHGRGYIQLTYGGNYLDIGKRLGENIAEHPNRILSEEQLAWNVSFAFWAREVHGPVQKSRSFHTTTEKINGAIDTPNSAGAKARIEKYKQVCKAFDLEPML